METKTTVHQIEHSDYLYSQTAAINTVVRDAIGKKWISLAKRNEIHAGTNEEGSYTRGRSYNIRHTPTLDRGKQELNRVCRSLSFFSCD